MTVILYAPNVHHGGGLRLLAALAKNWPDRLSCTAFLDRRAAGQLALPAAWEVQWVAKSFLGRLEAEWRLSKWSLGSRLVFCFHNLPPIFSCQAPVVCYVHNQLVIGRQTLSSFSGWTRLRTIIERVIARVFRRNIDHYLVQTPTMAGLLKDWLGSTGSLVPSIHQMPFADPVALPPLHAQAGLPPQWDFIYVSDGQAHKNHERLFEAWAILGEEGLKPSLAVTLHLTHDRAVIDCLDQLVARHGLNIVNLRHLRHEQVVECYGRAKAVVFASYAESFGLPLLEARAAGLPILAAELDFVRDICEPAQTFDAFSPISIARAVKRHLGRGDEPLQPFTPEEFIDRLLSVPNCVEVKDGARLRTGPGTPTRGAAR